MTQSSPRVLLLGLDSVPPELLFLRFRPKMPHLDRLIARSRFGTLRSCDPPITVPAWAVMMTGMDPGALGLYGFRHRRPGSYFDNYTPTSGMLRYPSVWDVLSRMGRRVAVLGMPPGYPPPTVNGVYLSDFLTPPDAKNIVTPAGLTEELQRLAGGIVFDVPFRAEDRSRTATELFEMTRRRWKVARHLWVKEPWDFFAVHDIGPDRLHHAFWKYFDPRHPRYEYHPKFSPVAEEYYQLLDSQLGELLELVPPEVTVIIASDHGSQGMTGCFCVNDWLRQEGYLVLRGAPPAPGTPIEECDVDWGRTRAWGAGGYYARIFFNVQGREPEGVVAPDAVDPLAKELRQALGRVLGPDGRPIGADVRRPRDLYQAVNGDAPDLMVYFGDLRWRSAGTVGHPSLFLSENDTGPDDSVHSMSGVIAVADPLWSHGAPIPEQSLIDVAPTILARLGVAIPPGMQGRPIDLLLDSNLGVAGEAVPP
ncbi:MAG: alkaline phosphatase family protein [Candidatus Lutacidiplasmatales archaeon]